MRYYDAILQALGTEIVTEDEYTGAAILAKLLDVDGATSGLDADLLDGNHAAAFQPADADLTAIAALSGTGGYAKRIAEATWEIATPTAADVGAVPYTGATEAVTLGANTISTTSGVITPKIYPTVDSTTAIQINKANGTDNIINVDTTNGITTLSGLVTETIVSAELITNAVDRDFSGAGNWVGGSWVVGSGVFTHAGFSGDATLANGFLASPPAAGKIYLIECNVTTTTGGSFKFKIGNADNGYVSLTNGSSTYSAVITAVNSNPLIISPFVWAGSVDNISVKEITPSKPVEVLKNSNGSYILEIRGGGAGSNCIFIGENSGLLNYVTAITNLGIGKDTLRANRLGTFCIAIGDGALKSNITGGQNFALGYSSQERTTSGTSNVSTGNLSLQYNITGSNNTGYGYGALQNNNAGNYNLAMGTSAGQGNAASSFSYSSYVGAGSGRNCGNNSDYNSCFGANSGFGITTGKKNNIFGYNAGYTGTALTTGDNNIIIGTDIGALSSSMSNRLIIGNIIYGTACDGYGTTVSTGSIGIGTTLLASGVTYSRFNVNGSQLFVGASSIQERPRASITPGVIDNTDASRKYKLDLSAWDTSERIGLTIEASGTAPKLGFFGATAVVKATALTADLTPITHTAPGTPDYAIQDMVQNTGFGFATADEGNTILKVILNLQNRVKELEDKLKSYGLLT